MQSTIYKIKTKKFWYGANFIFIPQTLNEIDLSQL